MSLFFGKTVTPQNGLLLFFGKETHSETKIMEIVEEFDKKSYNNNGKPWKSSRILRVKPNFFILSLSVIFLHFSFSHFFCFSVFLFFIFSFFCHVFSFSFIFLHFLTFSFIFFHFCFSLLVAQNLIFFGSGLLFGLVGRDHRRTRRAWGTWYEITG